METQETVEHKLVAGTVTGFKATNAGMQCRGFQFELDKWHDLENDEPLGLCANGFHFCKAMSGVWAYHDDSGTRVFKIEAEQVLDLPETPGADYKLVCRRIRLVEEVAIGGDGNTGDGNTGNGNTGDWNTGDWNTGDGNTGDFQSGFFCQTESTVLVFDVDSGMTRQAFLGKHGGKVFDLGLALHRTEPIDFDSFSDLPGITPEKLKSLHEKHLAEKQNTDGRE